MPRLPLYAPLALAIATALATCLPPPAMAADPVFDATGFNAHREYFSELPYEHIDPLTGGLVLTFTDLVLPGNAGFNLKIQRSYSSKIYSDPTTGALAEDSWAGIGWTMHLGRIIDPHLPNPILELPDGTRQKLHARNDTIAGRFRTRKHIIYDRNFTPPYLDLPNGVTYRFGYNTRPGAAPDPRE